MTLEEAIAKIKPLDHNAMEIAQKRWDSIAKPLHSLGKLETPFDPDRGNYRKRRGGSFQERSDRHVRG